MASGVRWTGLQEFKTDLHNLPEDLAEQAGQIVIDHAEEAKRDVSRGYPVGPTGNLQRGVRLDKQKSRLYAVGKVSSTAPHAHLFERGTRRRQTATGANRGVMPEAPESQQMIPQVIQIRRRMVSALIKMVELAGFKVTSS